MEGSGEWGHAHEDMVVFVMIICLSIVGELVLVVRLA